MGQTQAKGVLGWEVDAGSGNGRGLPGGLQTQPGLGMYRDSLFCLPAFQPPLPPLAPQDVMTDRDVCSGNRGVCAGTIDHPALGATQLC